ncbi:pimeloyl-ACP methyl ester carboxylesterase [Neobacillus niacini]|uniref:alpha/beta fold hydrolase n=1 Tax=Neobacillus driksii TaxID=3035913 RepID=UPI0027805E19|nr:alpha/beta hydrolase [Neobacillus niacini]MDQ0971836.1 pimeloyl-ACP methyl ester carboxylesterase [Neobacillus niacini]
MPMMDVKDVSLYYNVKGNGTPIVFIHPPLLTSENFRYQMDGESQDFSVITFDIRGHGRSHYSNQTITYPLIVEDIKRLLDHLGIEKAFLCGYSTGASIALEFMLTYSDRAIGGILVSGMSEASDLYLRKRISLAVKLANSRSLSFLAYAITWGNSDTKEMFRNLYNEAVKGDARNINQYFQYSLKYNCTNQLDKIELPILLVYGKKDKSFHRYANLLKEKLPCSELYFIDKEKHQIPTKAATKLNPLIAHFVDEHNSKDFKYSGN